MSDRRAVLFSTGSPRTKSIRKDVEISSDFPRIRRSGKKKSLAALFKESRKLTNVDKVDAKGKKKKPPKECVEGKFRNVKGRCVPSTHTNLSKDYTEDEMAQLYDMVLVRNLELSDFDVNTVPQEIIIVSLMYKGGDFKYVDPKQSDLTSCMAATYDNPESYGIVLQNYYLELSAKYDGLDTKKLTTMQRRSKALALDKALGVAPLPSCGIAAVMKSPEILEKYGNEKLLQNLKDPVVKVATYVKRLEAAQERYRKSNVEDDVVEDEDESIDVVEAEEEESIDVVEEEDLKVVSRTRKRKDSKGHELLLDYLVKNFDPTEDGEEDFYENAIIDSGAWDPENPEYYHTADDVVESFLLPFFQNSYKGGDIKLYTWLDIAGSENMMGLYEKESIASRERLFLRVIARQFGDSEAWNEIIEKYS